jgi:hypothetical protein
MSLARRAWLFVALSALGATLAEPRPDDGARDIFRRYLETRPRAGEQHQRIVSRDPGGNEQVTRSWLRWKDERIGGRATGPVVGKTLVRFTDPFDVRDTAFLVFWHEDGSAEQFVYRRLERKVRHVRMRSATVMGTDFTIDDLGFRSLDHAHYRRLPDGEIGGEPVYVIDATARPSVHSAYRRGLFYIEQRRHVLLRARFFDGGGREIKELRAEPGEFERIEDFWVPRRTTARDLRGGTESTLVVDRFDPADDLPDALFSPFRLWYEPG